MPDETALRELSEGVIEKLKLLTDAEFTELEFTPDWLLPPVGGVHRLFRADGWFAFGSYDGVHMYEESGSFHKALKSKTRGLMKPPMKKIAL